MICFDQLTRPGFSCRATSTAVWVAYLDLPEEGDETFEFLDEAHAIVAKYYSSDCYVVGNSTSAKDLSSTFGEDNMLISILSALFVILVLLFTLFTSAALGAVDCGDSGQYLAELLVPLSAGQPSVLFGLSGGQLHSDGRQHRLRHRDLQPLSGPEKYMKPHDAIVGALNEAFPTIFTSGTILAVAGSLIGVMTTNPVISSIGSCLGRGTIISIVLVFGVLPQILLLGDTPDGAHQLRDEDAEAAHPDGQRHMRVDGHVRGYISGVVDADFSGVLHGQMNAAISTGTTVKPTQANADYYLDDVTSADDPPTKDNPDASDENNKGGEQQ